ncbi:MAG: hypothetical protein WCI04_03845 [archaeon]
MQKISKTIVITLMLFFLALSTYAISADEAIAIVSAQNNYIMSNETASVSKGLITYKSAAYQIVAASVDSKINAYIPIKNTNGEIASNDIEVRELIKATIIYSKMGQLNQSTSASDWPFSYSTKSYFGDLSNDFGSLMNSIITVKTELNKLTDSSSKNIAKSAIEAQTMTDDLAAECTKTVAAVEKARVFEQEFFNAPDTNKATLYENYYNSYFTEIESIKQKFNTLDAKLTEISQAIGALENAQITVDQKRSFQSLLTIPVNARRLPNFFSTVDAQRTQIESIFNEAKNSGAFATTLASRKSRSQAWVILYGRNEDLIKLDSSFTTLQVASEAILSTDNVDLWANQDAVSALKTNWSGAQSRFNNIEYDKAKDFATKAISNVKLIIKDGATDTTTNNDDLIIKAIMGLVIAVIVIFVLQKFVLKKKDGEGELNEQEYK